MLFSIGVAGSTGIGYIIIPLVIGVLFYLGYLLEKDYRNTIYSAFEVFGIRKFVLHIPIYCIYAVSKKTDYRLFYLWLFSRLLIVLCGSLIFGLLIGKSFEDPIVFVVLPLMLVFMASYFWGVSIIQNIFLGKISWMYSYQYESLSFCITVFPLFFIICCIIEPSILAQL